MIRIDVVVNPLTDVIDFDLTERRMNLIHERLPHSICSDHPDYDCQIAYKAFDGKEFAAPLKMCCTKYERTIMGQLEQFLVNNPI